MSRTTPARRSTPALVPPALHVIVALVLHKSTKGTHVYTADTTDSDDPAVPTLYIRKSAFGTTPPPTHIVLSIRNTDVRPSADTADEA
jgi:hypothetical protein